MKIRTQWRAFLYGLLSVILSHPAYGKDTEIFRPTAIEKAPVIDGRLDEGIWEAAFEVKDLIVIEPDTKKPGAFQTRIKMVYDKEALYLGIINEQPADTQVRRISARDRKWLGRDAIRVVLDPSGQGRYGYLFEVALGGALSDGTMQPEWRYSLNWDGPWLAATSSDENHWYAEFKIPWDIMEWPDKEGKRQVGVSFRRQVSHLGEYWAVPPIPFNALAFLSDLAKMEVLDINPRGRLTFYPYISADFNGMTQKRNESIGTDVFWQPSSNMLVSGTINPDFGQVEIDNVVVNFGPIETLFQEKRPFFLEGNEIFQTNGLSLIHTRRIGTAPDRPDLSPGETISKQPPISDILAAVKITGQKENLRYGLMTAFEDNSEFTIDGSQNVPISSREVSVSGRDFYAARALYESNATGYGYVALGYLGTLTRDGSNDAWVHAFDGQWQSSGNRYRVETQIAMSDIQGEKGFAWNGMASYFPVSGTEYRIALDYIDDTFDINDMGYMERNDRLRFYGSYRTYHYDLPKFKRLSYSISARGEVNDRLLAMRFRGLLYFKFHNLTTLMTELSYMPATWDDLNSFGNGDYRKKAGFRARVSWSSDQSKPFSVFIAPRIYTEDNGGITKRLGIAMELSPLDIWQIGLFINYYDRQDWILYQKENRLNGFDADELGFSLDSNIRISPKHEVRLGIQWVGIDAEGKTAYRIDPDGYLAESGEDAGARSFDYAEFSGQIRYKYEFAPLSDLFVVYSRGSLVYWDAGSKRDGFGDLLSDSLEDKDVDRFLVKVRYRF